MENPGSDGNKAIFRGLLYIFLFFAVVSCKRKMAEYLYDTAAAAGLVYKGVTAFLVGCKVSQDEV